MMSTINYLAKVLPEMTDISMPIRQLTKKDAAFLWDENHDMAFARLKLIVTEHSLLKSHEPEKDIAIQCNARGVGPGAALIQEGKPLADVSLAFISAERNYAQIAVELVHQKYTFARR